MNTLSTIVYIIFLYSHLSFFRLSSVKATNLIV